MTPASAEASAGKRAVLEISDLVKDYRGLRPLRIHRLTVAPGEQVAVLGFDQPSAEVFVNLVTGATLPDAGRIAVCGRATADIADSADWLSVVDRFGIVSARAVLLEELTALQNLAMPLTLEIEPPSEAVRLRAERVAEEVGLERSLWIAPVAELDAAGHLRVRFGRALALAPSVLLLEHASAGLPPELAAPMGEEMRAVASRRGAAIVAATADRAFARAVATRVLTLEPATGQVAEAGLRGWFRRLG